ncbi:Gfo/Idh/MocA family oxidoreductase [Henriciella sp.]|uniref:Gfo/Idh/MocA family oxidoreductase n=1 Tax=Henriciella sp. TaxID=1968823 RepID=UPI002630902F|nr:Gfo/Idh/MocA family oxidoreductase [Henriciella sp.]
MTALRLAIIGKSPIASRRCRAIERRADAQVVRTWTTDASAGFTDEDWAEALSSNDIDAIILALPEPISARVALIALRSGVHVLSELTSIRKVEDIINLREAERKSRAVLKFGCGLRYHQSVREASGLISQASFGRLLTARAVYGHAGFPGPGAEANGILCGHGIHMLDLLHHFCGPFETVKAMCSGDEGAEANLFAILGTGSGTLAQLHASATSWRQTFRLELGFEEGYVWLDGHLPAPDGYGPEMLIHARLQRQGDGSPQANPDETIKELRTVTAANDEITEFIDAISGRSPLRHGTSHHAFDAINIAQRICAATETWA